MQQQQQRQQQQRPPQAEPTNPYVAVCVLVWLTLIHVAAVFVFTSGFLLTRAQVPYNSTCEVQPVVFGEDGVWASPPVPTTPTTPPTPDDDTHEFDPFAEQKGAPDTKSQKGVNRGGGGGCWGPTHFEKVVIVLVDALRVDFMVYNDTFSPAESDESAYDRARYYRNHLPVFDEILRGDGGEFAKLFRFVADAPTTTMQRLKGMTTGGLPTFIDFGSNFDSEALNEDNLIDQIVTAGRNILFLGDDTWEHLFPTQFNESHPYPSFNVKDLHTVDNGIMNHLLPAIVNRSSDWDVLIAHFLGVDHAGHRYGPEHPAMAEKLDQMDGIFRDVVASIDDDTLLLVFGDHGMTWDGNHGGATFNEVSAGLFAYTRKSSCYLEGVSEADSTKHADPATTTTTPVSGDVMQVDLVPTLSLLMGLPVPYGNLGSAIPQLMCAGAGADRLNCAKTQSHALHLNAWQVNNYIHSYAQISGGFPSDRLAELDAAFSAANELYNEALLSNGRGGRGDDVIELHLSAVLEYQAYLRRVADTSREIWATFDLLAMGLGVGLLALSCVCIVVHMFYGVILDTVIVFPWISMLKGFIAGSGLTLAYKGPTKAFGGDITIIAISVGAGALGSMVGALSDTLPAAGTFFIDSGLSVFAFTKFSIDTWCGLVAVACHVASLFSNSYILEEEKVVAFLLSSLIVVRIVACLRMHKSLKASRVFQLLVALVLVRVARSVKPCRSDVCPGGFVSVPLAISITCLIAIPLLLYRTRFYYFHSSVWTATKTVTVFMLTTCCVLISVYWATATHEWVGDIAIPKSVYIMLLASVVSVLMRPVTAHNVKSRQDYYTFGLSITLPILFEVIVSLFVVLMALVTGSNSVVSLWLWILVARILVADADTTPPKEKAKKFEARPQLRKWAEMGSKPKYQISNHGQEKATRPFAAVSIIAWAFLALLTFFATGHENAFNKVDFNAAFVGFDEFTNQPVQGFLLWANTFGAYALAALSLPLLIISSYDTDDRLPMSHAFLPSFQFGFLLFMAVFTANTAATALFVAIERRHLMVFRIFAPKYVFDSATLLTVDVVLVLTYAMLVRSSTRTWDDVRATQKQREKLAAARRAREKAGVAQ